VICSFCPTELPAGALFCGECGHAVVQGASKTQALETPETPEAPEAPEIPEIPEPSAASAPAPPSAAVALATAGTAPLDPFPWGLPAGSVEIDLDSPIPAPPALPPPVDEVPVIPAGKVEPDLEQTRIVGNKQVAARFVLQFSTGESVTLSGTGILGRNPTPEPGEFFDSLVTIVDPGRSVSKTHLEFGQEAGSFWLSDRYSGNGTVVRDPELAPVRCEAGKRYFVHRGSRVDIGEQFFVVS